MRLFINDELRASPLAGSEIQFLSKKAREIKFVLEARLRGNFLDGEFRLGEQVAGADQAKFQQILMRTQASMRGKCMPRNQL